MLIDFPSALSITLLVWICQFIKSKLLQIFLTSADAFPIPILSKVYVIDPRYTRSVIGSIIPINPEYLSIISLILSLIFIRSIARRWLKEGKIVYVIAFVLVAAGTFSNAIDRLTISGVLDYILIGRLGIFNVEDIIIIIGYIIYLLASLIYFIINKFHNKTPQITSGPKIDQIKELPIQ